MPSAVATPLELLYEQDETAWLDVMSSLAATGRLSEMDFGNLGEYLSDMAKRDRREVVSRMSVLIAHLLKWQYQQSRRGGGWRETIELQRQELSELLESGSLRNHAIDVLEKAFVNGLRQAIAETGLDNTAFPGECPFGLDEMLTLSLDSLN